ncbi:MAG: immune inhibitor A [bacterium]|nr:immune inhibitor A [bacterium]
MIIHRTIAACLLAALIWASFTNQIQAAEKFQQARVTIETRADYLALKALSLDEVYTGEKFIDVIVNADELQALSVSGLKYDVSISDMTTFFQSRFEPGKSMGGYRTLSEIELAMDSIATANPLIVRPKWSIGNSLEGRPIYVMKISDNPLSDESEPELYYYAAHHAREVITPEALIYFMRYLTNNYGTNPQVTYLVNNREFFVSTCMNPDGYYYNEVDEPGGGGLWRKNRRNNGSSFGVDLNRNYGYQWGCDDEGSSPTGSSETYRGTGPFSEPETQVEKAFIESRNFVVTLSLHSFSDLFLYPWGYDRIYTPDNDLFAAMADTVAALAGYSVGPPWQLLYPVNGSSDDWGYGEQTTKNKNYAVTIEIGNDTDNFWPPTNRISPLVQNVLGPELFLARMAEAPKKLVPPKKPLIYAQADIAVSEFDLYWNHLDFDNPAQSYEVWQLSGYTRGSDNIETVSGNWLEDGFTVSTTRAVSGTKSYFSGTASNLNNTLTAVNALQVLAGDSLKFNAWYDLEDGWDYAYVEASTNGGGTWATLPGNITTNTNPNGNNIGNGITGASANWVQAKFSLASYVGQNILVRFRYVSDGFVNDPGLWIDDISPTETYSVQSMLTNTETDTTYHVSGLTDGAYYYRVRAKDAENQLSQFSNLELVNVSLTPSCTWLVGDANGSGTYSVSDAILVIAYVFLGGSAPAPDAIGSGDADCNGMVTISDALWIIANVFAGGPTPGAACDCVEYLK